MLTKDRVNSLFSAQFHPLEATHLATVGFRGKTYVLQTSERFFVVLMAGPQVTQLVVTWRQLLDEV